MKNYKFTPTTKEALEEITRMRSERKNLIFYNQKSPKENILQSLVFGISFVFCSVFTAAILTLIISLLNY